MKYVTKLVLFPRIFLITALVVPLVVSACGGSHQSPGPDDTRASILASRSVALPADVHRGWIRRGSGEDNALRSCPSYTAIRSGLAAHASSSTLEYQGALKLRISAYVYKTISAAHHALSEFTSLASETCIAHTSLPFLQHAHYAASQPQISANTTLAIGEGASTAHILIQTFYSGRPFIFRLDTTAVLQGRVVGIISTVARVRGARSASLNGVLGAKSRVFATALAAQLITAQKSR
jgi:hypothetical protein